MSSEPPESSEPSEASETQENDQLYELNQWLIEKDFITDNIPQYFADGVAMAKLLQQLYPSQIDKTEITAHHSDKRKLNNWRTLNMGVLSALNLKLTEAEMERIVSAQLGAAEKLLKKLMQLEKEKRDRENALNLEEHDVHTIAGEGDELVQLVVLDKYVNALKAVEYKEQLVEAEERKSAYMTKLLQTREERIQELRGQLHEYE